MKIVEAPDRLRDDTCSEGKLVEYYKIKEGWGDAVIVKCYALGAIIRDLPTGESFFFAYPFMRLEDRIQHNKSLESEDQCKPDTLVYFISRQDVVLYGKITKCTGDNVTTSVLTEKHRANFNGTYDSIYPYKGTAKTEYDLPLNPTNIIPS